jgi:signal recognition particle subunit SEC65
MDRTHRKDEGRQIPKNPSITNSHEETQKDHLKMEMKPYQVARAKP